MPFVPAGETDNTIPRGVAEGTGTRAFLHNLVANPELAKKYLRSLGDEVREYGSGWDFAFRKQGSDEPWTPADAHTLGGWLLNHIADAVIGAGTGIAATLGAGAAAETGPGAIAAGAAAGGLASGALEAGRQALGHALGVPDNLDVPQIAAATAGGALAEPLGAAGGALVRGVGRAAGRVLGATGRVLPEVAAKVADIEALGSSGVPGRSAGATLLKGAALTRGGRVPLIDPEAAGDLLRNAVRWINRVKFPEIKEADARAALETGFDLSRAMQTIESRTLKKVPTTGVKGDVFALAPTAALREERLAAPSIGADASDLLERIRGTLGFTGDWSDVPGDVATSIRRGLRREAAEAGAYEGVGGKSDAYVKMVKTAHAKVRAAIVRRMEDSGVRIDPRFADVSYGDLEHAAYERLNTLDFLNAKLRIADMSDAGRDAAVKYIRGLYGESRIAYLGALNKLDKYFSTGLRGRLLDRALAAAEQANIGAAIGNRGLGELLPRITGGGHIRTAAALLPVGGYLAGGPLGAIAGGVAASPKFILRAVRPVTQAGQVASSAAAALARVHLGGASRVIAVGAIDPLAIAATRAAIGREGGNSKMLVRQEEGPPRRRILIGQ